MKENRQMTNKVGNLGELFKDHRLQKKLSLEKLGKLTGMSPSCINRIENGSRPNPTLNTILKLTNALGNGEEVMRILFGKQGYAIHSLNLNAGVDFGKYIKGVRSDRGIALNSLMIRSGVDKGSICKLEQGKSINPTLDVVTKLVNTLSINLDVVEIFSKGNKV